MSFRKYPIDEVPIGQYETKWIPREDLVLVLVMLISCRIPNVITFFRMKIESLRILISKGLASQIDVCDFVQVVESFKTDFSVLRLFGHVVTEVGKIYDEITSMPISTPGDLYQVFLYHKDDIDEAVEFLSEVVLPRSCLSRHAFICKRSCSTSISDLSKSVKISNSNAILTTLTSCTVSSSVTDTSRNIIRKSLAKMVNTELGEQTDILSTIITTMSSSAVSNTKTVWRATDFSLGTGTHPIVSKVVDKVLSSHVKKYTPLVTTSSSCIISLTTTQLLAKIIIPSIKVELAENFNSESPGARFVKTIISIITSTKANWKPSHFVEASGKRLEILELINELTMTDNNVYVSSVSSVSQPCPGYT